MRFFAGDIPTIRRSRPGHAAEQGDAGMAKKLRAQISWLTWQSFLAGEDARDKSAVFSYLAGAEGRKGKLGRDPSGLTHLTAEGQMVLDARGEAGMSANHFSEKFSRPGTGGDGAGRGDMRADVSFRERSAAELPKATHSIAGAKAARPDDLRAAFRKSLRPHVQL